MNYIEQINNLAWKFPNQKRHVRLEKLRDSELEVIRRVVRNNRDTCNTWFAISADQWYNDISYLLKFRKKDREIRMQLKQS